MDLQCSLFKNSHSCDPIQLSLSQQDDFFCCFFVLSIRKVIKSYKYAKCEARARFAGRNWQFVGKPQREEAAALSSQSTQSLEMAELPHWSTLFLLQAGLLSDRSQMSGAICIPISTIRVHFFKTQNTLWIWDECNCCNSIGRKLDSQVQFSALRRLPWANAALSISK